MNDALYKSFHRRGLTQAKLAALTGVNRSVLARILCNYPGRGKETRPKIIPFLTPEELQTLGWTDGTTANPVEQRSTGNNVPPAS